jgi:adenine-specific DNA-methyltransferase
MPSAYKGFNYPVQSDERGPYVLKNELHNTNSAFNEATRPNLVYDVYFHPDTRDVRTEPVSARHLHAGYVKISPKPNNNGVNRYHAFRWSRTKVEADVHDLEFVESPSGYKVFTKVRDIDSTVVKDLMVDISTSDGARDLESLGVDPAWFDYPKPARLIQVLVACATDRDSVVLDFFAGSGTTAHAVALQNSVDGGCRRVICVNLPEPTPEGSSARKAGFDHISDITLRRLSAIGADGLGLRVFRLRPSNFRASSDGDELSLHASTLADGPPDLLAIAAGVLVKEGVPLDRPWVRHDLGGVDVVVSDGVAVVLADTIDDKLVESALDLSPRVLVFLEDGFADADAVKANAVANAKNRAITLKTV